MRKFFHKLAIACLVALPIAGTGQAQTRAEGKAPQVRAFPDLTPIYRVAGVADSGDGPNDGFATVVHCTNFAASNKQVQFIVRDFQGNGMARSTHAVSAHATFTAATHISFVFVEDAVLTRDTPINQGSMIIKATTRKVHCSAMIIDAGASVPNGIALSLTRLNQEKNAQE